MPTPSLAEKVVAEVRVIEDCLDHLTGIADEPNRSLYKAMVYCCTELNRLALRRMSLTDYEAIRRSKQQLLDDLHVVIPRQHG